MVIPVNENLLNPAELQVLAGLIEYAPDYPWFDEREQAERERFGLSLIRIGRVGLRGNAASFAPYMLEHAVPEDQPIKTQFASHSAAGSNESSRLLWRMYALLPSNVAAIGTGLGAMLDVIRACNNLDAALDVAAAGNGLVAGLRRIRLSEQESITQAQLAQGGVDLGTLVKALTEENVALLERAEATFLGIGVMALDLAYWGFDRIPGMAIRRANGHQDGLKRNVYLTELLAEHDAQLT